MADRDACKHAARVRRDAFTTTEWANFSSFILMGSWLQCRPANAAGRSNVAALSERSNAVVCAVSRGSAWVERRLIRSSTTSHLRSRRVCARDALTRRHRLLSLPRERVLRRQGPRRVPRLRPHRRRDHVRDPQAAVFDRGGPRRRGVDRDDGRSDGGRRGRHRRAFAAAMLCALLAIALGVRERGRAIAGGHPTPSDATGAIALGGILLAVGGAGLVVGVLRERQSPPAASASSSRAAAPAKPPERVRAVACNSLLVTHRLQLRRRDGGNVTATTWARCPAPLLRA